MNYKLLLGLGLLIIQMNLCAQKTFTVKSKKAIANYEMAISHYQSGQVDEAIEYIEKALTYEGNFIEAYLLMADIHNRTYSYDKEVDAYKKAEEINQEYFPYINYNLGLAYWNTGQYYLCSEYLQNFISQNNIRPVSRDKASRLLENCSFAINLFENPVDFNPHDLGDSINTIEPQYWPSLSIDGNTLVYTSMLVDSTKKTAFGTFAHNEDFFVSYKIADHWSKGEKIPPPLNSSENEGAQKLSADGKVMVYTGCNRNDGYGRCDIYFSYHSEEGWSYPINAGPAINTKHSEKQPMLSPDNRILYFASNRPGGHGGLDLYFSTIQFNGQWSIPENMGPIINSSMDDISPYIHADNQTMYFSSEGHLGLGMQDIFITRRDSMGHWQKPINMGYPINTYEDEFGLIIDNKGETAYYSSTKNGGSNNIYSFVLAEPLRPAPVSYLAGKIYDKESKKHLEADFELIDLFSGDTIMQSYSNQRDGSFLVCLPSGKDYAFNVSLSGYLFYSENFNLKSHENSKPEKRDIPLKAIKVGEKVILENIFFESDSYQLNTQSMVEIGKIRQFVISNAQLKVEIGGHTDDRASETYNLELSKKRAKSVYDALNLSEDQKLQLSYKGYGQSQPLTTNENVEDRALNRRTELKIIGKN